MNCIKINDEKWQLQKALNIKNVVLEIVKFLVESIAELRESIRRRSDIATC